MTKAAALYAFWSGFGLPAYEETTVPTGDDAPPFPYITYQVITDSFGSDVALTASVWYRSESWLEINAKAEEIGAYIGRGGRVVPCSGGAIWLKRGQPFAQSMGDDADNMIRRKYINITAEFLTEN